MLRSLKPNFQLVIFEELKRLDRRMCSAVSACMQDAEKKIATCEAQTEMWIRIAGKRLQEIKECIKQLRIERATKDKKQDETIIKRGANIIADALGWNERT